MQTFFKSTLCSKCFKCKRGLPREAKRSGGFTALEFAVVMTIASIITTTLIIQHNRWNDYLALKTQAYELSLMIRQAQIWSLGVREDTAGSGDRFNVGYGIYIDEDNPNNQNIYFADRNANDKWDSGETIATENKSLTRGVYIHRFCGSTGVNPCNNGGGQLNQLNITFLRPNPDANIALLNNGGGNGGTNPPVTVYLRSSQGNEVSVRVEPNGQISIQ